MKPGAVSTAGLLLLILVAGLVVYKTTGALRQVQHARAAGSIATRVATVPIESTSLPVRIAAKSLNYLDAVWPALVFGILISGAVRVLTPMTSLARLFERGAFRSQLVAGASGAPLMLCSCCVAPIFSTVYERSRRLAPSLALMIAAPALNPAALLLTFLLFPAPVAWARLWMSAAAVFAGTALVARLTGYNACDATWPGRAALDARETRSSDAIRFARACAQVAVRTVPVILLGVIAAVLLADRVQLCAASLPSSPVLTVALLALVAMPIALPTFFEIPLAATLLAAGAPAAAAAAVLFVGPAVNLPSLLTVGHTAGWKAASLVALMVWLVALAGGLVIG